MNPNSRALEPCRLGDAVGDFVERLAPLHARCGSLTEAWETVLPAPINVILGMVWFWLLLVK